MGINRRVGHLLIELQKLKCRKNYILLTYNNGKNSGIFKENTDIFSRIKDLEIDLLNRRIQEVVNRLETVNKNLIQFIDATPRED